MYCNGVISGLSRSGKSTFSSTAIKDVSCVEIVGKSTVFEHLIKEEIKNKIRQ